MEEKLIAYPGKVDVKYVHATLKHLIHDNYDLSILMEKSLLPMSILNEPNSAVTVQQYSRLVGLAINAMHDEALGFTDRILPCGSWRTVAHACVSSEKLGDALFLFCHFFNLIDWGVTLKLKIENERVFFEPISTRGHSYDDFAYATWLFFAHRFCSWLVNQPLPANFHLSCSAKVHDEQLKEMLYPMPIQVSQQSYGFAMNARHLELPVQQDKFALRHFLRDPVRVMIGLGDMNRLWSSRVLTTLRQSGGFELEFKKISDLLGVSHQTFRRHLAKEGTTFRSLKAQSRYDRARYYLSRSNLSIAQVSEKSGFSEPSAFNRAFKNWTGVSPTQFRESYLNSP